MERDEPGFTDLNLKLTPLLNRCFDSLFPAMRYSPTLVGTNQQVFLLGGYYQQGVEGLSMFHKYDHEDRKWVQIRALNG